jgi:hypothetical protein
MSKGYVVVEEETVHTYTLLPEDAEEVGFDAEDEPFSVWGEEEDYYEDDDCWGIDD